MMLNTIIRIVPPPEISMIVMGCHYIFDFTVAILRFFF